MLTTELELYGHLENLSETTKQRIRNGFDEIRAISGWENFRIPSYVWYYMGPRDRDSEINFLESIYYDPNLPDPLAPECPELTADLQFVFAYTLFLYLRWWLHIWWEAPHGYDLFQKYVDDIGIPSDAITINFVETDMLAVTVNHPLHDQLNDSWDVAEWLTTASYGSDIVIMNGAVREYIGKLSVPYPNRFYGWVDGDDMIEEDNTFYIYDPVIWDFDVDVEITEEDFELYGHLEKLNGLTVQRIRNGFDEIRSIPGWENFRIPSYVWDYVDPLERDKNIHFLENMYYYSGLLYPLELLAPECPELTVDLQFVFAYTLFLYLEWWIDNPARPIGDELFQKYVNDVGIPNDAINIDSTETNELGVTVNHPLHDQLNDSWDVIGWWVSVNPIGGYIEIENGTVDESIGRVVDPDSNLNRWFVGGYYTIDRTNWIDYGITANWTFDISTEISDNLELYGHLENLSETTKQRIRSGFDEIRSIPGWENFRIPSYVWDYVDQNDRDEVIERLEYLLYDLQFLYDPPAPECSKMTAEIQFAFAYTWNLYFQWWKDSPNRPDDHTVSQNFINDIGVPETSIVRNSESSYGLTIYHPLHYQLAYSWDVFYLILDSDATSPGDSAGQLMIDVGEVNLGLGISFLDVDDDYGIPAVWDVGPLDIETPPIEITSTSTANILETELPFIISSNNLKAEAIIKIHILETKLGYNIGANNLKASATSSTDISETFMNKYLTLKVESVSSSALSFNKYNVIDFNMSGQYVLSSEYIVYANVINLNPDEFCEYSFSVDDPSKITIISQNGNTFRFYMRNNETVDVFVTATIFKYIHSDFTKTTVKEINNMISVGHEIYAPIYGIVDKMNPEIQYKLEHGIYKLKEIPIFKDLKIPVNVWNYIDIKFRDKLLEDIYDAIYNRRIFTSHFGSTSDFSKNEIFALTYIIHLMNAWYYKTPPDQKPSFFDFDSNYIADNWGILNLNENINGNIKTFSLDLNAYLGDINIYFEIENDVNLITLSRLNYLNISNGNYTELCFAPSLNDSYFKDVITGAGYLHKFSNHKEYAITTDNYITFYNNLNVYKPDFYEVPYYVSCVANETYGVPPFTYNWSVESEGQYFYLDNGNILSLAILTPDVKYNVKCIVEDASGYYRELEDTIILNSSLPEPSKLLSNMKLDFNFYKGKIKIPFDVPDENKNAILEEINLYVNKNINLLLTYMRQRASKGKFVDKVSSVKDIVVNNKYFLHTIDFDENEIFFYLKCSTDYSPKTAISRIYAIIYHVMTIHGYMDNVGGITIEYEPVLYSNRIIEDLKTYLNRMWKTKYFNINLQDAFDAMQKEVDLFLGSRTRYYSDANFERSLYKK